MDKGGNFKFLRGILCLHFDLILYGLKIYRAHEINI